MNNEQDYIETGSKMAQALQDIIDETCKAENCQTQTERCPVHAPDLTALADEWEQLYSRSALGPQQQTQNADLAALIDKRRKQAAKDHKAMQAA